MIPKVMMNIEVNIWLRTEHLPSNIPASAIELHLEIHSNWPSTDSRGLPSMEYNSVHFSNMPVDHERKISVF